MANTFATFGEKAGLSKPAEIVHINTHYGIKVSNF